MLTRPQRVRRATPCSIFGESLHVSFDSPAIAQLFGAGVLELVKQVGVGLASAVCAYDLRYALSADAKDGREFGTARLRVRELRHVQDRLAVDQSQLRRIVAYSALVDRLRRRWMNSGKDLS